jgi:hypothetical protein
MICIIVDRRIQDNILVVPGVVVLELCHIRNTRIDAKKRRDLARGISTPALLHHTARILVLGPRCLRFDTDRTPATFLIILSSCSVIDIYMSKVGVYSCDLVSRTVPWRHAGTLTATDTSIVYHVTHFFILHTLYVSTCGSAGCGREVGKQWTEKSKQNLCSEIVWQALEYYPLVKVMRQAYCVTRIAAMHIIFTRIGCTFFTCDMYMCRLRHINDSVLSSLKMEGIRLLFFKGNVVPLHATNTYREVEIYTCSSTHMCKLGTRWRQAFNFTSHSPYTQIRNPRYQWSGRRSGFEGHFWLFGEEKNILPLPRIKVLIGLTARSLDPVAIEVPRPKCHSINTTKIEWQLLYLCEITLTAFIIGQVTESE